MKNAFRISKVRNESAIRIRVPGGHLKAKYLSVIQEIEGDCNIVLGDADAGYPSAGTRNVSACIRNRVCSFSNIDTVGLAKKIEGVIYPNDYHVKITITGCPNDCIKAHMQDIGVIGNVVPRYDSGKCIACMACVNNCQTKITNSLSMKYSVMKINASSAVSAYCNAQPGPFHMVKFYIESSLEVAPEKEIHG